MPDGTTPRGYYRDDFEAAWVAYLGFGSPHATNATHATPLARPVASVASVASPHPNGEDEPDQQAQFIRDWNGDVYAAAGRPGAVLELVRRLAEELGGNFSVARELAARRIPTPNGEAVWTAVIVERLLREGAK